MRITRRALVTGLAAMAAASRLPASGRFADRDLERSEVVRALRAYADKDLETYADAQSDGDAFWKVRGRKVRAEDGTIYRMDTIHESSGPDADLQTMRQFHVWEEDNGVVQAYMNFDGQTYALEEQPETFERNPSAMVEYFFRQGDDFISVRRFDRAAYEAELHSSGQAGMRDRSFRNETNLGNVPVATYQRVIDYGDHTLNRLAFLAGVEERIHDVPVLTSTIVENSGAVHGTATRAILDSLLG